MSVTISAATEDMTNTDLPPPPEEPQPSDCCGSGCSPCVFDIYDEELRKWKEECAQVHSKQTSHLNEDHDNTVLSTSEYKTFKLESVERLTKDTCLYRFSIPGNKHLGLLVGQHLILRGTIDGKSVMRQYTPISLCDCRGYFEVVIKIYDTGKLSSYIKNWHVGQSVQWRGPFGNFSYKPNQYRRIGMLAAGTGITPMIQVIKEILNNEADETLLQLVYACRSYDDLILKDFLEDMKGYWNFTVLYAVSREDPENKPRTRYGERLHFGRVDKELVGHEMPAPAPNVLVLICGTKSFDKDMINYLHALGYTEDMHFKF